MNKTILLSLVLFLSVIGANGEEVSTKADSLRKDALNVFMEANDFIRREIPYVNYVRDMKDAGIYIISTSQHTGSGGHEYTYFLVGQHQFTGMRDTLTCVTSPDETSETQRTKQVNTLKMGLMRYVAKTPLAGYFKIDFTEPMSTSVSTDRWNSWVFRGSFNGHMNGQKSYKSRYLSGNLSASRVTENWKINVNARYNTNRSDYLIDDSTLTSTSESKSISLLIVKSLSDHWSFGGSAGLSQSSYSNVRLNMNFRPGIEYDLFPYSQSTRRQLRILYTAGFKHVNYLDTTIYNKIRESLWVHSLEASYEVVQKWGSIEFSMEYSNYLHDWSKNNLSMDGYFNLRIAKGLSVNFGGGASLIHNQLNLRKEDLSYDEILLQRKEIATQFEYYLSFGLSYTFGSIYNNVVNPRFGNSGGGGGMIIYN
jgi:hypothetical protein